MTRREWAALAAVVVLAAAVRVCWFTGLQAGDDLVYSAMARARLAGDASLAAVLPLDRDDGGARGHAGLEVGPAGERALVGRLRLVLARIAVPCNGPGRGGT